MKKVPLMVALAGLVACSSGSSKTGGGAGEGGGGEGGGQAGSGGQGGNVKLDAAGLASDVGSGTEPDADIMDLRAVEPDGGGDTATLAPDGPVAGGPMVLTSPVVKEGQMIDPMYRCQTANVSPPLSWTPGPAGTQSYAMMLFHSTSVHWVLWDIPPGVTSLPMKIERLPMPPVPAGAKQAKPNLDGSTWYGYTGPCPATSSHYEYIVYALKVASLPGVTPDSSTAQVNSAISNNKLASAQLSVTAAK
jgi:Raf kinase inhibitor-like YbhB/YbcL family protein